jgi:hypothetical protein
MKHIKTFESFEGTEQIDEWFGQKFITGHDSGEKENAKAVLMGSIEDAIEEMESDPDAYAHDDTETLRQDLITLAKQDNWRGRIEKRPSRASGLINIIYVPQATGLQNLGSGAATGTGTKLMGGY